MLHPPQEGSNRSLAYDTLNFWASYGRGTMPGSPIGPFVGLSWGRQPWRHLI